MFHFVHQLVVKFVCLPFGGNNDWVYKSLIAENSSLLLLEVKSMSVLKHFHLFIHRVPSGESKYGWWSGVLPWLG